MTPQQQLEPQKRKRKEKAKLEFDAGKVFDPAEAKADDLKLDIEAGQFKARKGEGGDRRT